MLGSTTRWRRGLAKSPLTVLPPGIEIDRGRGGCIWCDRRGEVWGDVFTAGRWLCADCWFLRWDIKALFRGWRLSKAA